eukprot:jgi/Tetstr1/423754/TSEL_014385.t1
MCGSGSSTGPKMVAAKAAVVGSVEAAASTKDSIEATRREALPGFKNGMPPESPRRHGLFPIALDRVVDYLLGNPRHHPAADEYYHAACYGDFIAGSAVELRKLLAAACVTDGITPAFGQRLEAIVHSMEAMDDGHRFRLAYYPRKHWDTQIHHGDTFAIDVVRERYLRPGTENLGSLELTELLEL